MSVRAWGAVGVLAVLAGLVGGPVGAVPRDGGMPGAEVSAAAVDSYARRVFDASGVPGMSVVVTHGDRIVRAAGYGHDADGKAVTDRTPMRVASLSKSFTAAAVMKLVRAGRIALDEPVAGQLRGFTVADPRGARITVRQLLNQTSGLSDGSVGLDVAEEGVGSLHEEVDRLRTARLATEPGTHWAYCNVNYDVLARLVEVASGRPFGAYLRDHLFAPLGMDGSAVGDRVLHPADGYNALFGVWVPRAQPSGLLDDGGAGGVVTDARDMGRWLIAQNGHARGTLSASVLRVMHTPGPGTGDHRYAMGWQAERGDGGRTRLVHSGNLFTYYAAQAVVPSTGYGVAVMVNGAGLQDTSWTAMEGLLALTEGRRPPAPGHGETTAQLALAVLTLAALALGALGALRAGRWARRRTRGRTGLPWRAVPRLVPALVPVAVFAAYPELISAISARRRVTWWQLTYFAAPVTVALAVAALAGLGTFGTRLWTLARSVRSRT